MRVHRYTVLGPKMLGAQMWGTWWQRVELQKAGALEWGGSGTKQQWRRRHVRAVAGSM